MKDGARSSREARIAWENGSRYTAPSHPEWQQSTLQRARKTVALALRTSSASTRSRWSRVTSERKARTDGEGHGNRGRVLQVEGRSQEALGLVRRQSRIQHRALGRCDPAVDGRQGGRQRSHGVEPRG